MARILGIDYGTKRTGIAVTDPLKMIAAGLTTVRSADVMDFLEDYFKKEEVEMLVLGFPKKLNNQDSESLPEVIKFEKQFRERFPLIPVIRIDERFTSSLALDSMIRGGMKKKDRRIKGNIDRISAALILQSYLDSRKL